MRLVPGERAFDESWVKRRTESLRAGNPFEARLDEDFLQTHHIARQEA